MNIKDCKNKFRFVARIRNIVPLRYDLRLEVTDALKSWVIVGEGFTMNPDEIRTAKLVKDHEPFYMYKEGLMRYNRFEKIEVIVWDKGVYFPFGGGKDKIADNIKMCTMFDNGEIDFFLMGYRLNGAFKLIRKEEKHWELIKIADSYCSDYDYSKLGRSVITCKTFEDWTKIKFGIAA